MVVLYYNILHHHSHTDPTEIEKNPFGNSTYQYGTVEFYYLGWATQLGYSAWLAWAYRLGYSAWLLYLERPTPTR